MFSLVIKKIKPTNLNKYLIIVSFVASFSSAFGQNGIANLHYRNRIEQSHIYLTDSLDLHSSVLPLVNLNDYGAFYEKNALQITNNFSATIDGNKRAFRLYPLSDLGIGIESGENINQPLKYTAGIGAALDFTGKKWILSGKLLPYITQANYTADSIQENLNMDLGTTRPITNSIFQRSEIIAAYRPNKIFTFIGGYGKNFFGEGYRSLLLSDNASNYPFLKIETSFGGIKYVNLYSVWNNNTLNPSDKSLDQMKFSAHHYLSWNITRQFNLSVFESVVWQAKDTLTNRGYDLNYLNPVVFYRPVEYSNGSADNVLLGLNLSFKVNRNHCIYSQVIIDEFLLHQIKSGDKWWGNKWGIQAGYKSNQFIIPGLYFQTEFNVVRPFTYSHKYAAQNYGHLNASVTHPLGANFYEVLSIVSFKKENLRLTGKITFSAFGTDVDSLNYGQNIFKSYSDRASDFGNLIMQGKRTNVFNFYLIAELPVIEKIELYAFATYNYRMQWTANETIHNHFLMVGIRSRIWNRYSDF